MAVCFHETRETIDLLRRVVDKLDENNGCIGAEELWDGVQCVPAIVGSLDLTVARHGIRQMEGVYDVLHSFTSRLVSTHKAYIHTTRRRAHIPQLTIESLPPEILHHIVNDALDCTKPRWLVRYSLVSSKIRNTILDSPSLWASVQLTLDIPLWLIETIIRRSATLKLTMLMDDTSFSRSYVRSDSFVSKLSAVFNYQHMWREVTFTVAGDVARLIQEHFPRMNLASVRVLRVNNLRINFFEKWDIPRLEKLEWSNDLLLPPSGMAALTSLLSLSNLRDRDVMSMAAFLSNTTGLRTLKLRRRSVVDDSGLAELPEIRLSCLEHLRVEVLTSSRIGTTARLLNAILCPGLQHFHLQVPRVADFVALTEDMRGRYPLLTFFQLSLEQHRQESVFDTFFQLSLEERRQKLVFFDELLSSLPSAIQKVQLGGQIRLKFHTSRRDGNTPNNSCASFPNLKVLDLSGCDVGEENFYANLSNTLKRSHVTLNHFRPCRESWTGEEFARKTLRRAGVLVDL